MLAATPGSVVVCHRCPFQAVTAGWPARVSQKTSWPGEPDGSRSLTAASEVAARVPGSSLIVQGRPEPIDPVASAIAPCWSTKNTLAWSGPVVMADSGVPAATP